MALHQSAGEKSTAIAAWIGEGVPDLHAASPAPLTALAGPAAPRWSLHLLTFLAADRYRPPADVCPAPCVNADSRKVSLCAVNLRKGNIDWEPLQCRKKERKYAF